MKKKVIDSRNDSERPKDELPSSSQISENMRRLGELLDEEWDEEESDVHIEEAHFYGNERPTLKGVKIRKPDISVPPESEVTKPDNEVPKKETISPKAKRITAVILAIAAGIGGAIKIIWEAWHSVNK